MKRNIYVLVLIAILIAICSLEEYLLKTTYDNMQNYSTQLTALVGQHKEDLSSKEVIGKFDETKGYWDNQKKFITYFTNYDKIRSIDESFIKLEEALDNNDKSLALENLSIINASAESLHYFMGFNVKNLF
ncbi:MAG: DUF4363 family protein [Christensenellales bacterium]